MEKQAQVFGTYSVMIAQNILNKLGLNPSHSELMDALKNKDSIYYPMITVPMANTLNGLILSQIETYKLFCQKRLCDYIILTNPTPEQLNAANGEDNFPDSFVTVKEEFEYKQQDSLDVENRYYALLTETQAFQIKYVKGVLRDLGHYQPKYDQVFFEKISQLQQTAELLKQDLLSSKESWKVFSVKLAKVISELGGFFLPPEDDLEQRAELIFFEKLGLNDE